MEFKRKADERNSKENVGKERLILEELLSKYEKYQYLNNDQTLIKILVNYIKPSFLFKTEILTPIHLGRKIAKVASKDGVISDEDLKWLHKNCLGDDDFRENISEFNRRVGFLTGTYWAYKNYGKLGNPKYFGSFGYRRLLEPEFLENLSDFDAVLPKKKNLNIETLKAQFINHHGEELYQNTLKLINSVYPSELNDFEDYMNQTWGFFDEIYVFKKEIFFDFCEWIFPLLFEALKLPQIQMKNEDLRDLGFIFERITGYFCNKLTKANFKILEVPVALTQKLVVDKKRITPDMLAKLRKAMK